MPTANEKLSVFIETSFQKSLSSAFPRENCNMATVSSTVGNKDNKEQQQQPMILKEDDDNSGKIVKLSC